MNYNILNDRQVLFHDIRNFTYIKMRFHSRRGNCPLKYWRVLSFWLYEISRTHKYKSSILVNSLMLLSDYLDQDNLDTSTLQLYAIAALECSVLVEELYPIDREDFAVISDRLYSSDQIEEAVQTLARHRSGVIRFVTSIDILKSLELESSEVEEFEEAKSVAKLCALWNPAFLTIHSKELAETCLELARTGKVKSRLEREIDISLSNWNKSPREKVELTFWDLRVLISFSKNRGGIEKKSLSFNVVTRDLSLDTYKKLKTLEVSEGTRIYTASSKKGIVVIKEQDDVFGDKLQGFLRELAIMASYRHENIIELKGFVIENNTLLLGMELGVVLSSRVLRKDSIGSRENVWKKTYIEGDSIESLLENNEEIADGIVRGVQYLHSMGVLHNDIKLDNIVIVEEDGRRIPKLIDFGLSLTMVLSPNDYRRFPTFIQTSWYKCPEILLLRNSDDDAVIPERMAEFKGYNFGPDVWSVGVVLLEIETGIHPFSDVDFLSDDASEHEHTRILQNIALVLGNPLAGLYKDYPYVEREANRLLCIRDLKKRKRILGMLEYDPEKRILV